MSEVLEVVNAVSKMKIALKISLFKAIPSIFSLLSLMLEDDILHAIIIPLNLFF